MAQWIPKNSIIKHLPKHYQKFLYEMKYRQPAPVHYIEQPKYKLSRSGKEIVQQQNVPIPLRFPKESHEGIWGGEAVIQGYKKRYLLHRHSAHLWVPVLRRSVVYSEILDTYMAVILTHRTLDLIDKSYGFDFYLLKTPVVDLQSQLALNLRRKVLLCLARREMYPDDPAKQEQISQKYKEFIIPEEEADWHGLNLWDAIKKYQIEAEMNKPPPLKVTFRKDLIEKLNEEKLKGDDDAVKQISEKKSWISKYNPFGKPPEQTIT